MDVILLEKIRHLGNLGDKVAVKAGFARNFLIPESKAVYATPANLEQFEKRRSELEKKAQDTLNAAQEQAAKLNNITLTIPAIASDEGKLYGSIGVNEIKDALEAQNVDIQKREIILPEGPLHSVGSFSINIHLHSDVVATIPVEIVAA